MQASSAQLFHEVDTHSLQSWIGWMQLQWGPLLVEQIEAWRASLRLHWQGRRLVVDQQQG